MPLFLLNQPRCVFAHIPKTGGNSIRNVVFKRDYEGPWFGDQLPDDWHALFKFAFVRNPFDRVVSAWKMFCEGTEDDAWHLPEGGPLQLSLTEVLQLGLNDQAAFGHPRYNQTKPDALIRLKNHIIPVRSHRDKKSVGFATKIDGKNIILFFPDNISALLSKNNTPRLRLHRTEPCWST